MHPDLSSQYILISGAGRGLGRSVARHLARCGAVVGVSDIDAVTCEETAKLVRDAGGQAHAYPANLGRRAAFLEVGDAFAEVGGRIDAVVNNAAHLRYEKVEDVTAETFEKMVNI